MNFSGGCAAVEEIMCPVCGNEIRPVDFGGGRVWVCCGKVAHSEPRRVTAAGKQEANRSRTDDAKA